MIYHKIKAISISNKSQLPTQSLRDEIIITEKGKPIPKRAIVKHNVKAQIESDYRLM